MESNPFHYKPLLEWDSIRLLMLEPSGDRDAELRGSLAHTTIRSCLDDITSGFIALSYHWGDPAPRGSITLDGRHRVGLTASLDAALRDMRDSSVVLRIWADALCIDQEKVEEKNTQVPLMGSIYGAADHTVIYLGPLTSKAERVLARAARWHELDENEREEAIVLAEEDILLRPWFARTWILQELVLSRDPLVQCGRLRARWMNLRSLLLDSPPAQEDTVMTMAVTPRLQAFATMDSVRSRFHQSANTLLQMLCACRAAEATDPRDKVYGILGLVSRREAWPKDSIDYSVTVERLYTTAACHILDYSSWGGIQSLLAAADDSIPLEARPMPDLPSWAPDWTRVPGYQMPLPDTFVELSPPISQLLRGKWWAVMEESRMLLCLGRMMLAIQWLSPVFPAPSAIPSFLRERCLRGLLRVQREKEARFVWESAADADLFWMSWAELCEAIPTAQDPNLRPDGLTRLKQCLMQYMDSRSFMPHGLGEMMLSYLGGADGASPLQGRRLAVMVESNKKPGGYGGWVLAVLPCHARDGDIAVDLFPSLRVYLLRQDPGPFSDGTGSGTAAWSREMLEEAESLSYSRQSVHSSASGNRADARYRLVGECFAEMGNISVFARSFKLYALV